MSRVDIRQALEQAFDETTSTVYPIQFKQIGKLQNVPVPLARISCCGLFTLEVLQEVVSTNPPRGRYLTFSPQRFSVHGATQVVTFLKVMVSQAHRFATKDWLAEHIRQRQEDADPSRMRLDNVVWLLRSILMYALKHDDDLERADLEQLSSRIVAFVRAGKNSGAGYQIAEYPLIWIDTDAIAWHVEQGALFDSFADESLPFWERAYTLAMQGVYLVDEAYSDWAKDKRNEVQGYLRQCVQVLYRHYLSRFGKQGEERAILLLRRYVLAHPTEEDALRPLMELLGKRECYQEALEYYQRLCESLKDEGHEPDPRTQKTERYLRSKQIQRESTPLIQVIEATPSLNTASELLSHQLNGSGNSFAYTTLQNLMPYGNELPSSGQTLNSELLSTMIHRAFSKDITYDFLSSNIKTMSFRDEWQYIVNNLVAEAKSVLRAMVFDIELTRWWNTIAGQLYMKTNMELLKRNVSVKRIFLLSSIDMRLRMNTLMNAYLHHKLGIDVRVCTATGFQNNIPFKPDMFSVHDESFVALYYFSFEKPITNLLLEDKHISEFRSFYDELFMDDRLCTDIETVLARTNYGESFFASIQTQLQLLQRLDRIGTVTDLARRL
ncbi:MAG TPA: bacterial transcriptional activator domain-containing protein [Nitrososphaera sp.]|jgi:hypothetical protein